MPHELGLFGNLAISLGFALAAGLLAVRLGLPAIVGYLVAGVAIGPHTPGFIGDAEIAVQLADIGIVLLMFESAASLARCSSVEVLRTS